MTASLDFMLRVAAELRNDPTLEVLRPFRVAGEPYRSQGWKDFVVESVPRDHAILRDDAGGRFLLLEHFWTRHTAHMTLEERGRGPVLGGRYTIEWRRRPGQKPYFDVVIRRVGKEVERR